MSETWHSGTVASARQSLKSVDSKVFVEKQSGSNAGTSATLLLQSVASLAALLDGQTYRIYAQGIFDGSSVTNNLEFKIGTVSLITFTFQNFAAGRWAAEILFPRSNGNNMISGIISYPAATGNQTILWVMPTVASGAASGVLEMWGDSTTDDSVNINFASVDLLARTTIEVYNG
jgi:hypothetical protein